MLISLLVGVAWAYYGLFTEMAMDLRLFRATGFYLSTFVTLEDRYPLMIKTMAIQSNHRLWGSPPKGFALGVAEYLYDNSEGYKDPLIIPLLARDIEIAFWSRSGFRRTETKWFRHHHNLLKMATMEDYSELIRAFWVDLEQIYNTSESYLYGNL